MIRPFGPPQQPNTNAQLVPDQREKKSSTKPNATSRERLYFSGNAGLTVSQIFMLQQFSIVISH